jgi:hypothetical protein
MDQGADGGATGAGTETDGALEEAPRGLSLEARLGVTLVAVVVTAWATTTAVSIGTMPAPDRSGAAPFLVPLTGRGLLPFLGGFFFAGMAAIPLGLRPRTVRAVAVGVALVIGLSGGMFEIAYFRASPMALGPDGVIRALACATLGPLALYLLAAVVSARGVGSGLILLWATELVTQTIESGGLAGLRGPVGASFVLAAPAIGLLLARSAAVPVDTAAGPRTLRLPLAIAGLVPIGLGGMLVLLPRAVLQANGVRLPEVPGWVEPSVRAALTVFFACFVASLFFNSLLLTGWSSRREDIPAARERAKPLDAWLARAALANGLVLAALAYLPGWPLPALVAAALLDIVADLRIAAIPDAVPLGEAATVTDLARARAALDAAGIPLLARAEASRVLFLDFGLFARQDLYVARDHAARANTLLKDFQNH